MMKIRVDMRMDGFRAKILHVDAKLGNAVLNGIKMAGDYVRDFIKYRVLTGGVKLEGGRTLTAQTGKLQRSIRSQQIRQGRQWQAGSAFTSSGMRTGRRGPSKMGKTFYPAGSRGGRMHAARIFSVSPIAPILIKGSRKTWVIEPKKGSGTGRRRRYRSTASEHWNRKSRRSHRALGPIYNFTRGFRKVSYKFEEHQRYNGIYNAGIHLFGAPPELAHEIAANKAPAASYAKFMKDFRRASRFFFRRVVRRGQPTHNFMQAGLMGSRRQVYRIIMDEVRAAVIAGKGKA